MADFDYGALMWHTYHRRNIYGDKAAATHLREQIEAHTAGLRQLIETEKMFRKLCLSRAEAAEVEVVRLREALAAIEAGTYERKVNMPWRADGKPSKHDTCAHGLFFYETCEGCIDEHVRKTLGDAQ